MVAPVKVFGFWIFAFGVSEKLLWRAHYGRATTMNLAFARFHAHAGFVRHRAFVVPVNFWVAVVSDQRALLALPAEKKN